MSEANIVARAENRLAASVSFARMAAGLGEIFGQSPASASAENNNRSAARKLFAARAAAPLCRDRVLHVR